MLVFLIGCASVGTKISQDQINKIEKGKTSKSEILETFGKPMTVVQMGDKIMFNYIHAKSKNSAGNFIPVYNVFHSEINTDMENLSITFSKEGIVEDYSFSQSYMPVTAGIMP